MGPRHDPDRPHRLGPARGPPRDARRWLRLPHDQADRHRAPAHPASARRGTAKIRAGVEMTITKMKPGSLVRAVALALAAAPAFAQVSGEQHALAQPRRGLADLSLE